MKRIDFTKRNKLVMPNPKGKREKIMTIEIYENTTLPLIQKALPYFQQKMMKEVLQKSEKFQKNILKIITEIEDGKISEVILQDWSQYEEGKSSNGEYYYFGTHYYYNPEKATSKWIFSRPVAPNKRRFCETFCISA